MSGNDTLGVMFSKNRSNSSNKNSKNNNNNNYESDSSSNLSFSNLENDSDLENKIEDSKCKMKNCFIKKKRSKVKPTKSIVHCEEMTDEERAKEGIFIFDPFRIEMNETFLKSFINQNKSKRSLNSFNDGGNKVVKSVKIDSIQMPFEINKKDDMSRMGFMTHLNKRDPQQSDVMKKSENGNRRPSLEINNIIHSSQIPRELVNNEDIPIKLTPDKIESLYSSVKREHRTVLSIYRHGSTPLDIRSCPGVNLLTEDEFKACCMLRIRPALYFHARNTLLYNFHRVIGYFKKSTAQKMLRIDVNKTSKLYEFLVRAHYLPDCENSDHLPEPQMIVVDDDEIKNQI
jgi:hypothetical protein